MYFKWRTKKLKFFKIAYLILVMLFSETCSKKTPFIAITSPSDGAVVGGIVDITVEITDDSDIMTVGFFIDDSLEYFTQSKPYIYHWNTSSLIDSTIHKIYAQVSFNNGEYGYSDTISVTIYNSVLVDEDFEMYFISDYPSDGGWFEIWAGAGINETYIDSIYFHSGIKSFKLSGTSQWVRTDGIQLNLQMVHHLTYECAVYIPEECSTGAIFGFYYQINPTLGTIYNGVLFEYQDSLVYARGLDPVETGYHWTRGNWYIVKVILNYDNGTMEVWINNQKLADNIQPAPREMSNIFALATEYGAGGSIYYDDIKIYK